MEEDSRREAAITSLASKFKFKFKFTPSSSSSSSAAYQARLSKFQELHRRRLQIKDKSKIKKKSKGRILEEDGSQGETKILHKTTEDNGNLIAFDSHEENVEAVAKMASKKPQKLHWGLDTKERWERKSNM